MDREARRLRQSIVDAWRRLGAEGLDVGATASLAVRHEPGLLITPSGVAPDRLVPDDIVQLDWEGCFAAGHRPSDAWRLHRDLLAARSAFGATIYCESTSATALACHDRGLPPFHERVAIAGGGDIRCARLAGAETKAPYAAMVDAMADRDACLLAHRGLVVGAPDVPSAVALAIQVEALIEIYLEALKLGEPPVLTDSDMAAARARMVRLADGSDPEI